MKLYHSPTSPYVRKVMVLLHETGQLDDVTLVTAQGTPLDSSAMPVAQNPLAKVPTLERPDGPAIYDSRVICRYLDERRNCGLYPAARLYETLTLEATAEGIIDTSLLMTYETRLRPEDKQYPEMKQALWDKVARSVATLNSRWMSHLSGPLDMGQIAVACALGYLDFRHDAYGWRNGNDALADWYAGFSERDSMKATVPA